MQRKSKMRNLRPWGRKIQIKFDEKRGGKRMKSLKKILCAAVAVVEVAGLLATGMTASAATTQKPDVSTIAAGENFR